MSTVQLYCKSVIRSDGASGTSRRQLDLARGCVVSRCVSADGGSLFADGFGSGDSVEAGVPGLTASGDDGEV